MEYTLLMEDETEGNTMSPVTDNKLIDLMSTFIEAWIRWEERK